MSSSRKSNHFRGVNNLVPPTLAACLSPVPGAPVVADRPVQHGNLPFDEALLELARYVERAGWPAAFARSVAGAHAQLAAPMRALVAILPWAGAAGAYDLGWSPADLSVAQSWAASIHIPEPTQRTESPALLHFLYRNGIRQAPRRETAAERDLRSRRQWSRPLDELIAERKAVA